VRSDADFSSKLNPRNPVGGTFGIEQTAGFSHSGYERDCLFMNHGGHDYVDVSMVSGLDDPGDGRTWSLLDFDKDGWTDIARVNANTPFLRLYRNRIGDRPEVAAKGKMVAVQFVGGNHTPEPVEGLACRDGYGARVILDLGDQMVMREHAAGHGFAGQNSQTILVGIGAQDRVRNLEVRWPSGRSQELPDVAAGSLVIAYEDPGQSPNGEAFVVRDYFERGPLMLAGKGGKRPPPRVSIHDRIPAEGSAELTMYTTMATWCATCKGELPQLATLRQAFGPEELEMRAVPVDPEDTSEKLARYVEENRPVYRLLTDLGPRDVQAVESVVEQTTQLKEALPATLVTNSEGVVLLAKAGVPSVSDLKKLLNGHRQ
jgi:thiol-disulfide isomerase/thioredoxin